MSIGTPPSPGLLDSLSAGYRLINRRPWLIGIPAGVSAYLWLGAPLTITPLAASLRDVLNAAVELVTNDTITRDDLVRRILMSDIRVQMAWLNLLPVLPPDSGLGANPPPVGVSGPLQLGLAVTGINLLALLASSLFLTLLSATLRNEPVSVPQTLRRTLQVAGQIVLCLLILLGVGLILGLPFLAITAIVIASLPQLTAPLLFVWYVVLFWAYVYTGFTPEALLIGRSRPLRAIYHSVNTVRRNLTSTLGLLLINFVIFSGLGVLWRQLATSPLGLAAAIVGSAYIGSGLSAARLEFYRERLARRRPEMVSQSR